jgi:CarboxypepD_reg-like domain
MKKILLFLFLFSQIAFAQTQGIVLDENNEPMIGTAIQIKNTTRGVLTDAKGEFTINAQENDILIFKSLGYRTEFQGVSEKTMTIKLKPERTQLDEVKVVGYSCRSHNFYMSCICPAIKTGSAFAVQLVAYPNPARESVSLTFKLNNIQYFGKAQPSKNYDLEDVMEEFEFEEQKSLDESEKIWGEKNFPQKLHQDYADIVFSKTESVYLVNLMGKNFYPKYSIDDNFHIKIDLQSVPSGMYIAVVKLPYFYQPLSEKVFILNQ